MDYGFPKHSCWQVWKCHPRGAGNKFTQTLAKVAWWVKLSKWCFRKLVQCRRETAWIWKLKVKSYTTDKRMDKDDRNCLELQVDRSNDQGEGGHWTPQRVLQHHCHLVGQCQEGESTSGSTPKFPRPHLPVHSLLNSCMDCVVAQMGFNSENRLFPSSLVYLPISSFLSPGLLCDTQ